MSTTYPQYPHTNYPDTIDHWEDMIDINLTLKPLVDQYYTLYNAGDFAGIDTLFINNPDLKKALFNAEKYNILKDTVEAQGKFFKDNVNGYIETKQIEFEAEIDKFTDCGTYNPTTQYYTKNFVDYNGEVFLCLANSLGNAPNPNATTTYWKKLSIKGETGYGVGLSPKNDFSASTTYHIDDLVQYNGNLYRCILESTGNYPTNETYFKLFLAGNGETYSNLATDNKTSLVGAINEIDAHTDDNTNKIGILSNLTTTEKGNLVGAISEVNASLSGHTADLITDADGAHGFKQEVISFTPTLLGATTAGTPTYTSQYGRAVRQGKLVNFVAQVQISNKGGMAGNLRLSGLPIASIATLANGLPIERIENWTKPANSLILTPTINSGTTIEFRYSTATLLGALQASDVSDTFNIRLSGQYEIA